MEGGIVMSLFVAMLLCLQETPQAEKQKQAPKAEKQKTDQEVEITSTRLEVPLKETPVATTVIDQERIDLEHVESVTELLRGLPGFYISRTGASRGSVTSLFARGTNSNHTLVLVDGFRATRDGARFFGYDTLTPDNLGRVEAQRGAASAAYGSDAIGGVLNFISRRGEGEPTLKMSIEGGTFTTWRESTEVQGGTESVGYSAALSHFSQRDGRYPNSDFNDLSFAGRVDMKVSDRTSLKLISRYVRAETQVPTNGPPRLVPLDPNASRQDKFLLLGGEATHWLTDWLETTLRLSRLDSNQFNKDPDDASEPFSPPPTSRDDFSRTSVELQAAAHLKQWGIPMVGMEYDTEELVSFGNGGLSADVRRHNKALFAQWSLSFWERLFVTPGVRVENNGTFGTDTNARVAAAYLHKETQTKIRATWGSGITEPSLDQVFGSSGNRNLNPEQSSAWDVGVDQWLLDDHLRFGVTYFETRLRSLIEFDGTTFVFFNGGDGITRGIEAEAECRFLDHAVVGSSFTYLRTRTTHIDPNAPFEGSTAIEHEPFLRRPTYSGRAYLGYNDPQSFGLFLDLILVGSRQDSTFQGFPSVREKAKEYVRVDLSGFVRLVGDLRAIGRIENLFDSPYEEVIGFPANHGNFLVGLEYVLKL
jgi:vitamin B12 transporter